MRMSKRKTEKSKIPLSVEAERYGQRWKRPWKAETVQRKKASEIKQMRAIGLFRDLTLLGCGVSGIKPYGAPTARLPRVSV